MIAGATTPEQVAGNVAAGDWEPTADDLATLRELTPSPLPLVEWRDNG